MCSDTTHLRRGEHAHLLCLPNKCFLKLMSPLDHIVPVRVGPLKLAPTMDIHLIVELFREGAHLGALLQHFSLQSESLGTQRVV